MRRLKWFRVIGGHFTRAAFYESRKTATAAAERHGGTAQHFRRVNGMWQWVDVS